jgi:hypothetical protein
MQQMAFVPHIVVILPPGRKEFALVHWDFYFDLPIGTLHLTHLGVNQAIFLAFIGFVVKPPSSILSPSSQ